MTRICSWSLIRFTSCSYLHLKILETGVIKDENVEFDSDIRFINKSNLNVLIRYINVKHRKGVSSWSSQPNPLSYVIPTNIYPHKLKLNQVVPFVRYSFTDSRRKQRTRRVLVKHHYGFFGVYYVYESNLRTLSQIFILTSSGMVSGCTLNLGLHPLSITRLSVSGNPFLLVFKLMNFGS